LEALAQQQIYLSLMEFTAKRQRYSVVEWQEWVYDLDGVRQGAGGTEVSK